jgi:hypothetical protein
MILSVRVFFRNEKEKKCIENSKKKRPRNRRRFKLYY